MANSYAITWAKVSPDQQFRYALIRVWRDSLPRLVFVMLNPSTADALKDDPTIRKCVGFARRLGFGGIEVVNLYAYHDDQHTGNDWLGYIGSQQLTAVNETLSDNGLEIVDPEHYRQRLVKIAALAFAAIESLDRRHPRPLPGAVEEPQRAAVFQPYEDGAGEFRWRFLAGNGQIMADGSEGYASRYNLFRAIETFRELVADATVEEL